MAARSSKCKACGARTTASGGYCQRCKSLRHHGYKRIKEENLILDQAGGSWWIWDSRGNVVVAGKPTSAAAVIALAKGDIEDVDIVEETPTAHSTTRKKLDQDLIDHAATKLGAAARRHVRGGMGPASAARAAIRETQALFPLDWHLGVQGDDTDDFVEVWEIEHKHGDPITRVLRGSKP